MKKYKLIKEYPGSPKLGYIIKPKKPADLNSYYYEGSWFAPSVFSEFWKEIIEKDYEVLSFISNCIINNTIPKNIVVNNVNGLVFKGLNLKTGNKITSSYDLFLNNPNWNIHSVKRLSDGEIFTIGDKIKTFDCGYKPISSFKIEDNICLAGVREHGFRNIANCKKYTQPLFTTEDGIDIFEGDTVCTVRKFELTIYSHAGYIGKSSSKEPNFLYFSTKEKAEDYILENKPCLSLKEIIENMNEVLWNDELTKFKKLIKSKL